MGEEGEGRGSEGEGDEMEMWWEGGVRGRGVKGRRVRGEGVCGGEIVLLFCKL